MADTRLYPYEEESQGDKLARKAKETPVFPLGKLAIRCVFLEHVG